MRQRERSVFVDEVLIIVNDTITLLICFILHNLTAMEVPYNMLLEKRIAAPLY
jgi:hypothetical protein